MSLSTIDLKGLGCFSPDQPATFQIHTPHLPTGWDYILQNRQLLLRVDQYGPIYSQYLPPSDIVLFRREPGQRYSSWRVWIRPEEQQPFTNFLCPIIGETNPVPLPESYQLIYSPASVCWKVLWKGWQCETEFIITPSLPAIVMRFRLTNLTGHTRSCCLYPVVYPYMNPAQLAPWDRPEWYLRTGMMSNPNPGFLTRLYNMNSDLAKRRAAVLWSSSNHLSSAEVSAERFNGMGSMDFPEALGSPNLKLNLKHGMGWGEMGETNSIMGYPPVYGLQYQVNMKPHESFSFTQVLHVLPPDPAGNLPEISEGIQSVRFLQDSVFDEEKEKTKTLYTRLIDQRQIKTPDPFLDHYVNEWLPVQLDWVCSLDRGWPSGMRGSRDSANDFTALAPLDPSWTRNLIGTLLSCQRSDGWFPRQYSASGRLGKHDLRQHVDAGVWVIELVHEYLCFSKDQSILHEPLPWLDKEDTNTVWEHLLAAIRFFINPDNLGEHGLCKINEGDWLDAVNRAGQEGRGESVMVTSQVIIALHQLLELGVYYRKAGGIQFSLSLEEEFRSCIELLGSALRTHAWSPAGFYRSVFNDRGEWIFSENDPDGEKRIYGPASWFAMSCGVAIPDQVEVILSHLDFLRCEMGYLLYWPPLGAKPIPSVGRAASGDMPLGLWENGNAYNQGSHGFFGRALAVAGKGDLLYEVLQYLLPYDQEKHPLLKVLTPPYAVVNCWQQVPGFHHRGGLTFLTGSIAYALRMVYDWMFGIRPRLDALTLDPCVPKSFDKLQCNFEYLGKKIHLTILNPEHKETGICNVTLDGQNQTTWDQDPFSKRTVGVIPDEKFVHANHSITIKL